jgi:hypothetical protein
MWFTSCRRGQPLTLTGYPDQNIGAGRLIKAAFRRVLARHDQELDDDGFPIRESCYDAAISCRLLFGKFTSHRAMESTWERYALLKISEKFRHAFRS